MKTPFIALGIGVVLAAGSLWAYTGSNAQNMMGQNEMGKGMMNGGKTGGMKKGYMGRHGPGHKGNPVRHRVIRKGGGVPAPYTNVKNPLTETEASIKAGAALYGEHCQSCHGAKGTGDGEAGAGLEPKPANIAFIMDKWIATDPFLFWTISEGGKPLDTAMPAFKDTLSEEQRWQIIHYLRDEFTFGG